MLPPAAVDLLPRNQVALLVGAALLFGAATMATRTVDEMSFNLSLWKEASQTTAATVWTRVAELLGWKIPTASSYSAVPSLPVIGGRVTSGFNLMRTLNGATRPHKGTDIGKSCGAEIVSTSNGTVTRSTFSGSYGNVVYVQDGNRETRYGHMQSASTLKVGDTVRVGQRIGFMGDTGRSFGCHLHWEVLVDGVAIDAMAEYTSALAFAPPITNDIFTAEQWNRYLATLLQRESSGDYTEVNESCHVGGWQMSTPALVDAGLISPNRLAAARREFSGWQCQFVKQASNWKDGNLQSFLSNPKMQQAAIMDVTRRNVKQGYNNGFLSVGSTPQDIAEYAAVAHLLGGSCDPHRTRKTACDYFRDGVNGTDGNGTGAAEYAALGRGSI
ncbi:MAG: hypothetical protein BWK73_25440 [Thiothrix lacustris]|uniref:M23ase beta-sheet core domain-containing protein n=1 Tax=Thiothrix lacustris TaxID=525917 RepID=A0A1Y1QL90_9GAMM|nr:MAG: hypothetical protein BWK73_25440 [Thiothrix lacustris]